MRPRWSNSADAAHIRVMTEQSEAATQIPPVPAAPERPSPPTLKEGERGGPLPAPVPGEVGGPKGPEPTRYGDWESKGRATDF